MSNTTIKALFLIATIFILIVTVFNVEFVASQMSDENWYRNESNGVVIFDVTSGGVSEEAGLLEGDRLVMINGDSIRSALQAQSYLDNAEPGASLIYTIEREGRIFDVKVNLALAGVRIEIFGALLAGILFLLYSLFIIFTKPENQYVRLLAVSTLLFSFFLMNMQQVLFIGSRPYWYQILLIITVAIDFIAIAVFGHAALYFPEKKYDQIKRFWMIYVHYIIAGLMIVLSIFYISQATLFNSVFLSIPLLYLTFIELINWKRRRKEYLARIKIIKYTIIILFFLFITINLVEASTRLSFSYLAFLGCLLPIAYFYTTIRYRVYNIYTRIRLSLVYTIIQTSIFIVFIISLAFLIRFLPLWEVDLPAIFITGSSIEIRNAARLDPALQKQIQQGYLILIAISLTLIFYLLKNRLQRMTETLFFQQKYDYRNALKQFGELLSSSFTMDEIGQRSVEQIHHIMKVKGTSLALAKNGKFYVAGTKGNLSHLALLDLEFGKDEIKKIIQSKQQLKQVELVEIPSLRDKSDLIYCGTPVITANNKLEAILFTGEKLSESAYNNDDLEILNLFAENLGMALERTRLYEQMTEKERLERELEIARDIQLNSLPKNDPDYSGLQICSALTPATEVGGDYYDYLEIDDIKVGIIIGDVVGKGTSGAIHMSKIQGFLQTIKLENLPTSDMFSKLNTLIWNHFQRAFFFTALYGLFNTKEHTVEIYRMGHNGLIYYNAKKQNIKIIEPDGIAFGMTETEKFREQLKSTEITYSKDDIFVFLTDGFYEAMDQNGNPFGEDNICQIIRKHASEEVYSIMDRLQNSVKLYSSGIQRDDATGIIIKITR